MSQSGAEGPLFAKLQRLTLGVASPQRSQDAWCLTQMVRAHGEELFHVAVDMAIEKGLFSIEDARRALSLTSPVPGVAGPAAWTNPCDGSQMIWIPPGKFLAGAEDRPVTLPGFYLARHPITNTQFQRFVSETGYAPSLSNPDPELFLSHFRRGAIPAKQGEHPVVFVSFVDALAYCHWAELDLPSEWMWEKAARGVDGRLYPWGKRAPRGDYGDRTVRARVGYDSTCPVGSFPKVRSPYGCEDLVGNVSEWCYFAEPHDATRMPDDLRGDRSKLAAVRGSCFLRRIASRMVGSHRRRLSIHRRNRWVGFRPAFFASGNSVADLDETIDAEILEDDDE